jgi:3-oxoacyl-[acyl-carrier protein] reductase
MNADALEGQVAVVTGGNTGIGRAIAEAFAAHGADVVIGWYDQPEAATQAQQAVERHGRRCGSLALDVTDARSVKAFWAQAIDAFGRVDVLVNNAGIQQRKAFIDLEVEEFDRMLAVHLRGAMLNAQCAARHMIGRGGGRIINVCSQLGYIGRGEYVSYSTAKGGLIAFTRALARELASHGILVNGVSPGLVDTGFDPLSEVAKVEHAESLPLARLGTPDDMNSAFVFLASDAGRYYCGQMLHPNGGEIMP